MFRWRRLSFSTKCIQLWLPLRSWMGKRRKSRTANIYAMVMFKIDKYLNYLPVVRLHEAGHCIRLASRSAPNLALHRIMLSSCKRKKSKITSTHVHLPWTRIFFFFFFFILAFRYRKLTRGCHGVNNWKSLKIYNLMFKCLLHTCSLRTRN